MSIVTDERSETRASKRPKTKNRKLTNGGYGCHLATVVSLLTGAALSACGSEAFVCPPECARCIDDQCVAVTGDADLDASTAADGGAVGAFDGSAASGPDASDARDGHVDATHEAGDACGACVTPPNECYSVTGRCVGGRCAYDFVEGAACDDGNACTTGDVCTNGACNGKPIVCSTPPSAACTSGATLRTYDASGTCQSGVCTYAKHDIACQGACSGGACAGDPCSGVVCNHPPSSCFAASGTCSGGSCSYAFANGAACNDGDACTTGDVCASGVCVGSPMSCAAGCTNGTCNPSTGWTKQTSNTQAHLLSVWGSSPTSVWAVGNAGTALYWNGSAWQVRSTGTSEQLQSVHGTSANNVFASGTAGTILHFNGSSWSTVATLPSPSQDFIEATGVFAIGANDAFAAAIVSGTKTVLYRVTNGQVTQLGEQWPIGGYSFGGWDHPEVWAFSTTDVFVNGVDVSHWNGTTLAVDFARGIHYPGLWAAGAQKLFAGMYTNLEMRQNGSWSVSNTGSANRIMGVGGTTASYAFAVTAATIEPQNPGGSGNVFFYDGLGWSLETTPAVDDLRAVWVAASGRVFAVGDHGTILTGP